MAAEPAPGLYVYQDSTTGQFRVVDGNGVPVPSPPKVDWNMDGSMGAGVGGGAVAPDGTTVPIPFYQPPLAPPPDEEPPSEEGGPDEPVAEAPTAEPGTEEAAGAGEEAAPPEPPPPSEPGEGIDVTGVVAEAIAPTAELAAEGIEAAGVIDPTAEEVTIIPGPTPEPVEVAGVVGPAAEEIAGSRAPQPVPEAVGAAGEIGPGAEEVTTLPPLGLEPAGEVGVIGLAAAEVAAAPLPVYEIGRETGETTLGDGLPGEVPPAAPDSPVAAYRAEAVVIEPVAESASGAASLGVEEIADLPPPTQAGVEAVTVVGLGTGAVANIPATLPGPLPEPAQGAEIGEAGGAGVVATHGLAPDGAGLPGAIGPVGREVADLTAGIADEEEPEPTYVADDRLGNLAEPGDSLLAEPEEEGGPVQP